jgi:hypothetical protein
MRLLIQRARKDPQKTAALSVIAILGIGSLVLWLGYLRRPALAQPQVVSTQPKPPTTQRSLISSMADDAAIIQANALAVEKRRAALKELADARTLSRSRVNARDRAAFFETTYRRALNDQQVALQRPLPPAPTTNPSLPTTRPTP